MVKRDPAVHGDNVIKHITPRSRRIFARSHACTALFPTVHNGAQEIVKEILHYLLNSWTPCEHNVAVENHISKRR